MVGKSIIGAPGTAEQHDSSRLHVTGGATYTDDIPEPRDLLHLAVGVSEKAHAKIKTIDLSAVKDAPGVVAIMTAEDIVGKNNCGPIVEDDPIFAPGLVQYAGQAIFAVAADSTEQARKAALLANIEYEELEPILDIRTAIEQSSFVLPTETLKRGDSRTAINSAPRRLSGEFVLGGQEHFYLEGQVAMSIPREDGDLFIYSSTQHPGEIQHLVAEATGQASKDIVVECRRMGGAFGGKETQAALVACIAAIMTQSTGRSCKLRLDRDADIIMTGKRHDFVIDYDVGFTEEGRIQGIEFMFASRCGMSADLSGSINDRTMFHCDNAYFLENITIVSHRCKTNTVSNTAFRGFGGPQGMFGIEYVIEEIARTLEKDSLAVRRINFYGVEERNTSQYHQKIEDNVLHEIVDDLTVTADYARRVSEIRHFNESNEVLKRGISLTPVKFGISFTATHLNQAGALLHVYTDGTIHLNHGGTEMGQGLFTKVAQVVANEFQVDINRIKMLASDTSKVPNASATAASSGSDMNGKAAQAAARKIKRRLVSFASTHFNVAEDAIRFQKNAVQVGESTLTFEQFVQEAWRARVSLSATGFYRTPKINYDRSTFSGRPFYYYAYGAAVSEVIIDTLTGESRLTRVDILHDCGQSLNPAIDVGQIEGGFIQGVGWLTSEELSWTNTGQLQTHAPSTYKIPTCSDAPVDFRVRMLESTQNREETIFRSKGVGEPPLMLSLSVFHAIRDAVIAACPTGQVPVLRAPATPEAILEAISIGRNINV
tara:strand:- start:73 stop:2385 length:2313 start_codon:yes stop_codon:yes gene_type:complete